MMDWEGTLALAHLGGEVGTAQFKLKTCVTQTLAKMEEPAR